MTSARIAAGHDQAGLAILLDEVQEAPQPQLVVIANAIQDALATANVPLAVFAAGLPHTPEVVMAAASFTERFDFRVLDLLDATAAERALLEPALAHHVTWEQDAAANALAAAGGSPYLIQRIGDEAWVTANPDAGGVITRAAATVAITEVRTSLGAGMFRGRWVKATPAEKEFMLAMAQVIDSDGIAQTRHLTALIGKSTPQLSRVRSTLLDKGLIESVAQGRLRFTMPGFAEYVRELLDAPWYGPHLATGTLTIDQLRTHQVGVPPTHRHPPQELPPGTTPEPGNP